MPTLAPPPATGHATRSGPSADSPGGARPKLHLHGLDEIRSVAVVAVMLFHYGLFEAGWAGVQVFFVLSGFLITWLLVERREGAFGPAIGRFFKRRSLRLVPAYYALVAALAVTYLTLGSPGSFGIAWGWLVGYAFNFLRAAPIDPASDSVAHLWSLSVEVQFYLVWGFVALATPRRWLKRVVLALIVLGPFVRLLTVELLTPHYPSPEAVARAIYALPHTHMDAFAWGALMACWPPRGAWRRWFMVLALVAVAAGGAITLVAAWNSGLGHWGLGTLGFPISSAFLAQPVWAYTLINAASAAWLLVAITAPAAVGLLRHAYRRIGVVSYGIYLWHLPLLAALHRLPWFRDEHPASTLLFPVYLALSWGVAEFSFRFVEQRFLLLKDR